MSASRCRWAPARKTSHFRIPESAGFAPRSGASSWASAPGITWPASATGATVAAQYAGFLERVGSRARSGFRTACCRPEARGQRSWLEAQPRNHHRVPARLGSQRRIY